MSVHTTLSMPPQKTGQMTDAATPVHAMASHNTMLEGNLRLAGEQIHVRIMKLPRKKEMKPNTYIVYQPPKKRKFSVE